MEITINVKDETKVNSLIEFLRLISFIEIKEKKKPKQANHDFENIFGIWKNREISIKSLRDKAWNI